MRNGPKKIPTPSPWGLSVNVTIFGERVSADVNNLKTL